MGVLFLNSSVDETIRGAGHLHTNGDTSVHVSGLFPLDRSSTMECKKNLFHN